MEDEAKKLFSKMGYDNIEINTKERTLNEKEIELLLKEKCYETKHPKIEIDIYGYKKNDRGKTQYVIGECKFKNKAITMKEIKCFVIKANVIAEHLEEFHQFQSGHFSMSVDCMV